MGQADLEVFFRERMAVWDETVDTSSGSSFDNNVVQPILRRIGVDPYTVDIPVFIQTLLSQEFPDLAQGGDDAITDLFIKPFMLLMDPLLREQQRISSSLSLKDAASLTKEEADALGANFFATRDTGQFAQGTGRIYYAQPQPERISSRNFVTSKTGLHFFPTGNQSITAGEMQLNREGSLYYFDVNLVAEAAGEAYSIGPDELATIALLTSPIRVTNKQRFRYGRDEEDAPTFVGRLDKETTEKSNVTLRGIVARTARLFPSISRLSVVGYTDPEMKRDIISGGSLGPVLIEGSDGQVVADGEYRSRTRRFYSPSTNFTTIIGPIGAVTGFVLTCVNAFGGTPLVKDLDIVRVVDVHTVEVSEQALFPSPTQRIFTVRKREVLLSQVPGGIISPTGPNGTVSIEPDKIHVGGCFDVHVREATQDEGSLVLDIATDDEPELSGSLAGVTASAKFSLFDYTLDSNYVENDAVFKLLDDARKYQYTLEITTGTVANIYRILQVTQVSGSAPLLTVDPAPTIVSPLLRFNWRLVQRLEVELAEPKNTRIRGTDGSTIINSDVFYTTTDLDALGVSPGDTLRVFNGSDAGDCTVEEVLAPGLTSIRTDKTFLFTSTNVKYQIFKANTSGGVSRPFIRVKSIELLDTSGQPTGSKVPYAKPALVLSKSFANAGNGVVLELQDAITGIVSLPESGGGFAFGVGGNIVFSWDTLAAPIPVPLVGNLTVSQIVTQINNVAAPVIGVPLAAHIVKNNKHYVGIIPVGPNTNITAASNLAVLNILFGSTALRNSGQVRSPSLFAWPALTTAEELNALNVLTGINIGIYSHLTTDPSFLQTSDKDMSPDVDVSIQLGTKSFGGARLLFVEPTSIEVDENSLFSLLDSTTGGQRYFTPDPTLYRQVIPPLPDGTKPLDGGTSGTAFTSLTYDFVRSGIREGDTLTLDFAPKDGSVSLADPVTSLVGKDIRFVLDNGNEIVVVFMNDVATPGAVSKLGVASQINAHAGETVCSIVDVGAGDFRLRFNPTRSLVIKAQPTSLFSANTLLGFSNVVDTNNNSPLKGSYLIMSVAPNALTIGPTPFPLITSGNQFTIKRKGEQRISTTQMSTQVTDAGMYYWDVELISQGAGDAWNIDADVEMRVDNYRSDGYYVTTRDANLSFSPYEEPVLHVSRSILEVGTDDDSANSTQITGQSLLVTYEYSEVTNSYNDTIRSDTERIVNASPLARHLMPYLVRFSLVYAGGPSAADVKTELEKMIRGWLPDQPMYVYDIQQRLSAMGVSLVTNPLTLYAVVHDHNRNVQLLRSQNALNTERLAAFIPDLLDVTRVIS